MTTVLRAAEEQLHAEERSAFSASRQFLMIFGVALLIRLVFVAWMPGYQEPAALDSYSEMARNIMAGEGLGGIRNQPSAYRVPGYPVFLAGIYTPFGLASEPVWIVQSLLSALTAALIAAIARRHVSVLLSILAGLFAACYPPFIYYSGRILSETLFAFLFILSLWLLLRSDAGGLKAACAAGVLMGLASLTRPVLFYFPLGLAGYGLLKSIVMREPLRSNRAVFTVLACFFLTLAPWGIRNWICVGSPVLTSTEGGWSLWLGLHPDPQGFGYGNFGGVEAMYEKIKHACGAIDPFGVQAHQFLMKQSIGEIAGNPLRFCQLALLKVGWLYNVFDGEDYRLGTRYNLPAGILLSFGLPGLWLGFRKRGAGLLCYGVFYFTFFAAVIYGIPRFRIPLEPLLMVLAVIGVQQISQMTPRWKTAWTAMACALVLMQVVLALAADDVRLAVKGMLESTIGYQGYFRG